jgi:2-hydroxy-6-oxonona-2,4-dienedioate hydrolase
MDVTRLLFWRRKRVEALQTRWIVINGCRLHTRLQIKVASRARPPIVLVHGLSMSSRYLMPTAERLAERYCVYVPDLPGFGKSDKPRHALNVPQLADVLLAWMDEMQLDTPVLLGNSLGCQIILELAARNPLRAAGLILAGPTVDPLGRSVVRLLLRTAWDALHEPPTLLAVAVYDYLHAGLRRTWRTLQHTVSDPVESKLHLVSAPTLIVRGDRDRIVPQSWVETMHQKLPNSRLHILPQGAHGINFSEPDELASLVDEFVEAEYFPTADSI